MYSSQNFQNAKSLFRTNFSAPKWTPLPNEFCLESAPRASFYSISNAKSKLKQRTLYLLDHLLIKQAKDGTFRQLDVTNFLLSSLEHLSLGQGVRLSSECYSLRIFGPVDIFFDILRLHCIQNNFDAKYKYLTLMSKGYQGDVYKIRCKKTLSLHVAKVYDKRKMAENSGALRNEVQIMRTLRHATVIKLQEVFEDSIHVRLVYELYGPFPTDSLPEEKALALLHKLLGGVDYIHKQGIVHRDLKPHNVLLDKNGDPIITDFGLAEHCKDGALTQRCGTPGFMAPEILMGKPYNEKVDIYSLGIIFYILLTGKEPFSNQEYHQLIKANHDSKIDLSIVKAKEETLDLLERMTSLDYQARPSAYQARQHPAFKKLNRKVQILRVKRISSQERKPELKKKLSVYTPKRSSLYYSKMDDKGYSSPIHCRGKLQSSSSAASLKNMGIQDKFKIFLSKADFFL